MRSRATKIITTYARRVELLRGALKTLQDGFEGDEHSTKVVEAIEDVFVKDDELQEVIKRVK